MLAIGGTFTINPERREEFVAAAITLMAATNAEEGCEHYAFSADLQDPTLIHLFERWTSEEALSQHMQTEHIADFRTSVAGIFVTSSVLKYGIESAGPL